MRPLPSVYIHSIGTAVPAYKIYQQHHHSILDSANGMNRLERLTLRKVYANSGVISRHSVLKEFAFEDQENNIVFHPSGKWPAASVSKRMELFETFAGNLCADAVR